MSGWFNAVSATEAIFTAKGSFDEFGIGYRGLSDVERGLKWYYKF